MAKNAIQGWCDLPPKRGKIAPRPEGRARKPVGQQRPQRRKANHRRFPSGAGPPLGSNPMVVPVADLRQAPPPRRAMAVGPWAKQQGRHSSAILGESSAST